jgi:phosphoserine phosphatase RsbU/P
MSTRQLPRAALRLRPDQLEHELNLARLVQQSLLPSMLPALPGARLAALNQPARIVSGDMYDVVRIDPDRVAIMCADVSGKGFPAALLASELQAYVRATLRAACVFNDTSLGPLPVQVVALINHEASRLNESGRYATLFFAEYDALERSLRYVNAGHNPPLLLAANDDMVRTLSVGGPPVGLFEDASYDVGVVSVPETGTLVIYTDGVVEARNPAEEEFGLNRLVGLCTSHLSESVDTLLDAVLDGVLAWCGDREPDDDITLVGLSGTPPEPESRA